MRESRSARFLTCCVALLALLFGACTPGASEPTEPPNTSTTEVAATTPDPTTTTVAVTTTVPPTTTTTIPTPEPIPPEAPEGMELVWSDEFDADRIDPTNWTYDIGGWGWGNGEAQYYTDRQENARVQNGLLVIEARQERYENSVYTSARLKTEGLREFQYGRIEARLKVPEGAGLWPAFWMLGTSFERDEQNPLDSNWPFAGEIDIMEYIGREPDLILGTIHGPGYAGAGGLSAWNRRDQAIAADWHTYAIEWDADGIRWFFDGEQYGEKTPEDVGDREWVFDQPFFIILNLAVGGLFPGPVGLDLEFPKYYYADYVRVYQPMADSEE